MAGASLRTFPSCFKKMPPSVIVNAPEAAPDGKGENNAISAPPPLLRIKDLLYGDDANNTYQNVKQYSCSVVMVPTNALNRWFRVSIWWVSNNG
jgi:hypothetical protein